jgi:hypothetical protein
MFRVTPEGQPPRFFMQRQFIPPSTQFPPDVNLDKLQITSVAACISAWAST